MNVMLLGIGLALGLNAITVLLYTNYISSVLLVMGGYSIGMMATGIKVLKRRDYIMIFSFFLFSLVITTFIEKLMIIYDVWGFSDSSFHLIGIDFWGAPIEEYVYWWMCPLVVAISFFVFSRNKVSKDIVIPDFLNVTYESLIAKYSTKYMQNNIKSNPDTYLKSNEINGSQYKRGVKFPVWIWVVIGIILLAALLYPHFKGSWKTVIASSLVFFSVAYPNELYSLSHGLWVYNQNRMIGPWVLGVPMEEWFMYFLSPMTGCMILSIVYKKIFGELL